MRLPPLAPALLVLAACGARPAAPRQPAQPATAPPPAPRPIALDWVPAHPSYLLASDRLRDLQQQLSGLLAIADRDHSGAKLLAALAHVDPFSADDLARIGIDVGGSAALFSEDLDPTLVVHLSSPDAARAFLASSRGPGAAPAQTIDGVEVDDSLNPLGFHVSWAIDRDWLWLHVTFTQLPGTAWFAHSHAATGLERSSLIWMRRLAAIWPSHDGGLRGLVDPHALLSQLGARGKQIAACTRVAEAIDAVGVGFDAGLDHVAARVTFTVGDRADAIERATLPPPPGWAIEFARAPVSIQLNLDLDAFQDWLQPCADLFGIDLRGARRDGVRALRLAVASVDDDASWGSGAVSVDLHDPAPIVALLDQIPMRSHLESDRTFGRWKGHHLSIPFKGSLDYVVEDHDAILALGDDVLASLASGKPASAPPPIAIDLRPGAMSEARWQALLDRAGAGHPALAARFLSAWRSLHLGLVVEGGSLVLEASGQRK